MWKLSRKSPSRALSRSDQSVTMLVWCAAAACLVAGLPAAFVFASWGSGFYVTNSVSLQPSQGVEVVDDDLTIIITGAAYQVPQPHEEEMLGHKWYDFGASFEIKSTQNGTYQPAPPESYTWVSGFPGGSQTSNTAAAVVTLNTPGYWRITGHISGKYWTSEDGKESDESDEVYDDSDTNHDPSNGQSDNGHAHLPAVEVHITRDIPSLPPGDPPWPLDPGVLCVNAQSKYNKAVWEVTVKPTDSTAKVTKESGPVSVTGALAVQDGDPVTVHGDGTGNAGQYTLRITSNLVSRASEVSNPGTAFAFVGVLNGPKRLSDRPSPDNGNGSWGDFVGNPSGNPVPGQDYFAGGKYVRSHHDDSYVTFGIGDTELDWDGAVNNIFLAFAGTSSSNFTDHAKSWAGTDGATYDVGTNPKGIYQGEVKNTYEVDYSPTTIWQGSGLKRTNISIGITWKKISVSTPVTLVAPAKCMTGSTVGLQLATKTYTDSDKGYAATKSGLPIMGTYQISANGTTGYIQTSLTNNGVGSFDVKYEVHTKERRTAGAPFMQNNTVAGQVTITPQTWQIVP